MVTTKSLEARDTDNRPFSGPSTSSGAGHCSTDRDTHVTTKGKRKCRSVDGNGDEHCKEKKKSIACSSREVDSAAIDETDEEDIDNRPFLTVNNRRNRDVRRPSDKSDTEVERRRRSSLRI